MYRACRSEDALRAEGFAEVVTFVRDEEIRLYISGKLPSFPPGTSPPPPPPQPSWQLMRVRLPACKRRRSARATPEVA